ncbi:hypothetical protein VI817_007899 [Penicillium citrinum]|nr:hypothetical protein VI817_007871 [Penicillium citrinum]KAK5790612.1 hypothetical protein VI817_007899 [Penicillium citrinum]
MNLTSNQRRARARQQCREALTAHIYERLGVTVAPQDVRLQPSTDSDYAWSVMPGKEYLLDTNLGNGSVGLYQEIQQHLGSMIEAVAPRQRDTRRADTTSSVESHTPEPASASFTDKIKQLEDENFSLAFELEGTRAQLEELESQGRQWQAQMRDLQEELEECRSSAYELQSELEWARHGIGAAVKALEGTQLLRKGGGSVEFGQGRSRSSSPASSYVEE